MKLLLCLPLLLLTTACSTVKPYQREHLALPGMRLEPTAATEFEQHMLEAREASAGGWGTAGGGCGCN